MGSLKAEVARREKRAEGLERQIADFSAKVESLRAGQDSGLKEGESSESVAGAGAPASPMAQEHLEGLRRQVEVLKGELERLLHERKQNSKTFREQIKVWLQCQSDEHQKQVFDQYC